MEYHKDNQVRRDKKAFFYDRLCGFVTKRKIGTECRGRVPLLLRRKWKWSKGAAKFTRNGNKKI